MGPGTGIGHIEMIAATLSRETTAPIPSDPAPEGACLSLKLPLLIAVLQNLRFSRHDLGLVPCQACTQIVLTGVAGPCSPHYLRKEEKIGEKRGATWPFIKSVYRKHDL